MGPRFTRQQRRFSRRLVIALIHDGHTLLVVTRDLSLGGVFVETDATLPFGALVELSFRVDTLAEPILIAGKVRWGEPGVGVGIQFDGLRARHAWGLIKFLD